MSRCVVGWVAAKSLNRTNSSKTEEIPLLDSFNGCGSGFTACTYRFLVASVMSNQEGERSHILATVLLFV